MRSEVIVTRWVERRPRLGAVFGERRSGRAGPVRACPSQRLSPGADDNRRPYGRRARASSLMSLSRTATDWSCSVWIGRVWLRQGQSPALEARSPMGGALAARTAEDQGVTVRLGDIKEEARARRQPGGRFSSAPGDSRGGGRSRPGPDRRPPAFPGRRDGASFFLKTQAAFPGIRCRTKKYRFSPASTLSMATAVHPAPQTPAAHRAGRAQAAAGRRRRGSRASSREILPLPRYAFRRPA
jgi:hypothetical protein